MRDRDTTIHGLGSTGPDEPRVSVVMQDEEATIALFFDPADAWSGQSALLEVRLTPTPAGEFEPWRLMPTLPLHAQYARASLAWRHDNAAAALRALREVGATRRGLGDDHYRIVAELYTALVNEGERYPIKALAAAHHVDKSTASRWVSAARTRGLLQKEER